MILKEEYKTKICCDTCKYLKYCERMPVHSECTHPKLQHFVYDPLTKSMYSSYIKENNQNNDCQYFEDTNETHYERIERLKREKEEDYQELCEFFF